MIEYRCTKCNSIFEIDIYENKFMLEKKYEEDCDLEIIRIVQES